ncbi:MAG: CHC2 zinc finger domain-containing protein [Candidatus Marinimicrobia bacterium]|nr:CHC2 zinc finger domain-containing protein [Candidatus Neomarinimicrobiota bacterium]
MNYLDFYSGYVKNFKPNGNGQASGLCPFHDDKHPSLSINLETGQWQCHGCGKYGNAITFAKLLNIPFSNNIRKVSVNVSETEINQLSEYLQTNLESLKNAGRVPSFWTDSIIRQTRTGFDSKKNCLTFSHTNIDGLLVNIKWHKPENGVSSQIPGHGQNRLYPLHLLRDYSLDKPLIYGEGEKDTISLLSMGLQAVTHTCGALRVPTDLTPLKDFKKIYIVFDNDPAGYDGTDKTAKALSKSFPEMQVYTYDWYKKPSGFDVTDYFLQGGNVSGFNHMMDYAIQYQDNQITGEGKFWLYRKITDSKVFKDSDLLQLWIFCLTEATHKRTVVNAKCGIGHRQITLDRGQFLLSLDKAHQKTGQPTSTLRDHFKKLEKMGNIRLDKVEVRTIVTICKWRLYQ